MVYLDTSVMLAQLLAEDRTPPARLWTETLVASRLIEYEVWNRLHAGGVEQTHGPGARSLLGRIAMLELLPIVLARALLPFPAPLRTLDALHLASLEFLRDQQQDVALASYDARMLHVGKKMRIPLYPL